MSAEPPEVESAMGTPAFGLLLILAASTGVEALGIKVFAAASARVEKGQNACARSGRSERPPTKMVPPATSRAPCSRNFAYVSGLVPRASESGRCWFSSIGERGNPVGPIIQEWLTYSRI